MPDIAMCGYHRCPSAKLCYRHEAEPDRSRQTYSWFEPDAGSDRCLYFLPLKRERERSQP